MNSGSAQSSLPVMLQTHLSPKEKKPMPFKSKAQRGWMNANRDKLEKQGVNVQEWNQASKGLKLPAKAPQQPTGKRFRGN